MRKLILAVIGLFVGTGVAAAQEIYAQAALEPAVVK